VAKIGPFLSSSDFHLQYRKAWLLMLTACAPADLEYIGESEDYILRA
jgi:hypothetical protein